VQRVLLGEFDSADACAAATRHVKKQGYARLDAYMPYPAKSIEQALDLPRSRLPRWVLAFGLLGAISAYLVLWWTQNMDYPLNVGGHPTHAVPAYIPISFETTVLFASVAAFVGMLRMARLPRLWHPVFEISGFERASVDRFFLVIETFAREADESMLRERLHELGALRVVALDLQGEVP
jgi:hypothetical protein